MASSIGVTFDSDQPILCSTYPVDPRVPLGAGDFLPGCSEAEVRTAVAVDLNVGGLAAGERLPGRGPEGTKKKVKGIIFLNIRDFKIRYGELLLRLLWPEGLG